MRAGPGGRAALASAGFTLIEALVALFILMLVMAVIVPLFLSNLHLNSRSETRGQAASALEQVLDDLRTRGVTSGMTGTQDNPVTVGGRDYVVRLEFCRVSRLCTDNSKMVTATALLAGQSVLSAETILTEVNYVAP